MESDHTADVHDEDAKSLVFEGVVIVGGGIAGLSTALALHRVGLKSLVLERGSTLRATGAALNLWTNAWKALHTLGVADDLRATHFRLEGSQMVCLEDEMNKQIPYRVPGKRDHEVRCVKRGVLLETLAAALPAGTIRYKSKVVDIFTDSSNHDFPTIMLEDGTYIKAKVLIGCDGVNSIVSKWLGYQPAKFLGKSTSRGLSTYPEGHDFNPKLYINLQHGTRAGYIPINGTDVFWFLNRKSRPQDSEIAQEPKLILQEALDSLRDFPEEYQDIVKRTLPDTPSLTPLRGRCPWAVLFGTLSKGTVTIAGDAMHAMTPYIGQGGCSTLEDAVVLVRCLAEGLNGKLITSTNEERKRIEQALKKYVEERRWRVFMLMTKSYITGLSQPGSGKFAKFLREKIMTKVPGDALSHAEYDCGGLFDTMK